MMHSATNRIFVLVFILLALSFFALMYGLLTIRFGGGDVYPAYSSLRADPKGTKALFESLDGLETIQVTQNFNRWNVLEEGDSKTIFVLGVEPFSVVEEVVLLNVLGKLAEKGHRIVLGFEPVTDWATAQPLPEDPSSLGEPQPEVDPDPETVEPEDTDSEETDPEDYDFGFDWDILAKEASQENAGDLYLAESSLPEELTPVQLAWRSTLYFTDIEPAWQVIYRHHGQPVLLERSLGTGSIVVLGDCYELSNQALWEAAEPGYVSWLVGANRQVVFNETHLGLTAQTNLMGLIRRFRLHGVLFGLLVLAVLFVWKQSTTLVPPLDSDKAATPVGRHAASGLIHLLSRGVPLSALVKTCVSQWRETLKVHEPHLVSREAKVMALGDVAESKNLQPDEVVAQYNQIQKVISTRSSFR